MLTVTHLAFDTVVERPISLNEHKGSAIRGAFFHALRGRAESRHWRGFCTNQSAPDCVRCPLLAVCPVARLLATHDPTGARGHGAFAGVAIGITLAVIHIVGIQVTGVSVNPARSFGPALLVGGQALSQAWVFFVAPAIGAVVDELTLDERGDANGTASVAKPTASNA